MRIGLLEEGLNNPKADSAVSGIVENLVNKLSMFGASIGRISVPLHLKGTEMTFSKSNEI